MIWLSNITKCKKLLDFFTYWNPFPSLRKIYQNTSFFCPAFSRIMKGSKILVLYGETRVRENSCCGTFYAVCCFLLFPNSGRMLITLISFIVTVRSQVLVSKFIILVFSFRFILFFIGLLVLSLKHKIAIGKKVAKVLNTNKT